MPRPRFSGLSFDTTSVEQLVLRAFLSMTVLAAGAAGYWAVHRLGRFLDEPQRPDRAGVALSD